MRILVLSDIHYASPAEQRRRGYEAAALDRLWQKWLLRAYRRYIWLRDPFAHNGLLDRFLEGAGEADLVVANGDYSCDSAFVGVSDDAAAESARLVLARLRTRFGERFRAVAGDHELGKLNLGGNRGGLRWGSWERATGELGLAPFWQYDVGPYLAVGLTSSVLALPVYEPEMLASERSGWMSLRQGYCEEIEALLRRIEPGRRLLLFLHDPTAIPYLAELPAMRARLAQVRLTVIGHLHSPLIYAKSRILAGMPPIRFLGNAVRRMSEALHQARLWKPFHVRLCPSLAGIELLKDGGFLELQAEEEEGDTLRIVRHRLRR